MKYLNTFIIYCLTCLSMVRLIYTDNSDDEKDLNDFFGQIQQLKNIMTRKVTVNGHETSITAFFQNSNVQYPSNGLLPISSLPDVNGYIRVLSVVVSCEYSESLYFLVKSIHSIQTNFIKIGMYDNHWMIKVSYQSVRDEFLKPLREHLSAMILTIVHVQKFKNNFPYKNHKIMTIMLSWYVYITDLVEKGDENLSNANDKDHFKQRLDMVTLTNKQIESFLKYFILTNCQRLDSFSKFENDINEKIAIPVPNKERLRDILQEHFQNKCNELKNIVYNRFFEKNYDRIQLFVMTTDTRYFDKLLGIIKQQVSDQPVQIKWNNMTDEDISVVYKRYVARNVKDIETVLKFERIMLQTITKFIVGYVSEILNEIVETPGGTDVVEKCNMMTIHLLDTYILKFKQDGQPLYLINNMSIIRTDLSTVCFKYETSDPENRSRMQKHAKILKDSITEISIKGDYNRLVDFLESLSKTVICTKLHPSISNAFWEKLYFVPANISKYVIDLKELYTQFSLNHNHESVCHNEISETVQTISSISGIIKNCENQINQTESLKITDCLKEVNSLFDEIILLSNNIYRISLRVNGDDDYNWRKLYLILHWAINNNETLKDNNIRYDIKYLTALQLFINDNFEIGFAVTCQKYIYTNTINTKKRKASDMLSSTTQMKVNNFPTNRIKTHSYRLFKVFRTLNDFIDEIVKDGVILDLDLRLYLDGVGMSLREVHQKCKEASIDKLQENYDYFRFLVRYIIAVVYYKMNEIIDGIIDGKHLSWSKEVEDYVESKFKRFMILPLYIAMPVKPILDMFVLVLKSFNGTDTTELISYRNVICQELERLGVYEDTLSVSNSANNYVDFTSLGTAIDHLSDVYTKDKHKWRIERVLELFGINISDRILMFREWYNPVLRD